MKNFMVRPQQSLVVILSLKVDSEGNYILFSSKPAFKNRVWPRFVFVRRKLDKRSEICQSLMLRTTSALASLSVQSQKKKKKKKTTRNQTKKKKKKKKNWTPSTFCAVLDSWCGGQGRSQSLHSASQIHPRERRQAGATKCDGLYPRARHGQPKDPTRCSSLTKTKKKKKKKKEREREREKSWPLSLKGMTTILDMRKAPFNSDNEPQKHLSKMLQDAYPLRVGSVLVVGPKKKTEKKKDWRLTRQILQSHHGFSRFWLLRSSFSSRRKFCSEWK